MAESLLDLHTTSSFANAQRYDDHCLSYHPETVELFLKKVLQAPNPHGLRILEIGAGTGKFTEQLVGALNDDPKYDGYSYLAVEPHTEMARVLATKKLPGVQLVRARAESMEGVESEWADAVVVAQAFHWFANPAALQEIRRVMKPGAPLFMVWYSTSHSPYRSITDDIRPWELKLKQLNESLDPRSYHPVFETEEWKDVFENTHIKSNDGLFSVPLSQSTISSTRKFTRDAMWNLVECYSYVAALEPERLSEFKNKYYALLYCNDEDMGFDDDCKLTDHQDWISYWTSTQPSKPEAQP